MARKSPNPKLTCSKWSEMNNKVVFQEEGIVLRGNSLKLPDLVSFWWSLTKDETKSYLHSLISITENKIWRKAIFQRRQAAGT
jgi:hypothetical protein